MSDHKEPDFSVSIYEEIESWPEKYRLKLLEKVLERECTHGDHPHDVKTPMYALVQRLRLYEYEKDGNVCISFADEIKVDDKVMSQSMGCRVEEEPCKMCNPDVMRITVKCKHSGQELDCVALSNGIFRWTCPCGHFYEKQVYELPLIPDKVVIDEDCRRKDWP